MKRYQWITASILVIASTSFAHAQSSFEGFYGQLGVGFENNVIGGASPTIVNSGGSYSGSSTSSSSALSPALVVGVGYISVISPQFSLGVGLDYSGLPVKTSTANSTVSDLSASYAYDYRIANRISAYISPGYIIDQNKLAYAKLGFSGEQVSSKMQSGSGGAESGNQKAGGFVVGLGYKQIISGGFYGFGEVNYYGYKMPVTTITLDPSGGKLNGNANSLNAYQFLAGVGYKF
ncbi:outer membrane protein [Polynucleobacter sp. Fuers-14]|uniref:outer membrane protein n=1 Tax=Polynucleobacter sp. Fuers-14 TaxID=1758364 RepID=UPI001C0E35FA|nr:outer membrane beta-barrel protein [Polynucleobacter sp. Fuers-14]MBU3641975.1 outer membrane beta-barrel protein [Polynucleobacter sp. Fuers-14]